MSDKNIEDVLDELIDKAGPKAVEELTKEDLQNIDKPAFEFSKEHEEKMQKFFEDFDAKKSKTKTTTKDDDSKNEKDSKIEMPTKATWKKVLLVAILALLIFATVISSVSAWRESFVKYFFNIKDEYSVVNEKKKANDFQADDIYFGYLPYGYEIVSKKSLKSKKMILFENGNGNYIRFESNNKSVSLKLDTENSKIIDETIDNKDMVYSEKDGQRIISWTEKGSLFSIFTDDIDVDINKIAQNIKVNI